jgi:23S rRNA (uracil1939-C5)-methyltransferase
MSKMPKKTLFSRKRDTLCKDGLYSPLHPHGAPVQLRIIKMVQGGDGMARLPDGRVCFVQGALPGELCEVVLTFQKKDFTRGRVVRVVEPSPDRVVPKCPLYGKCGGCSLQHLDSQKQAEYMAQVERENFRRLAHAELPENFVIHTGNPWGYRNRARVVPQFARNGECSGFAFREQESNALIPFENCSVLTPALNAFLQGPARKIFESGSLPRRLARPGDVSLNVFDNGKGEVSYYYRGMSHEEFGKNAVSIVEIEGRKIESDASVFFQSNLGLLPELVQSVRRAVDEGLSNGNACNDWLIDLFSGVGFFAALLQDKFKRITTVERDDGCLKHAKRNLSAKNSGMASVENVSAPAEEWLADHVVDIPATLIVDPPRTGLPGEALEAIVRSSVKRLIYVSCDPVTLSRDYAKLATAGFGLERAEGFAFYPQTPHMEMLFVLSR